MPKIRVLKKEKSTQEMHPHTHTVHENTKLKTYKPETNMTKIYEQSNMKQSKKSTKSIVELI